MKNNFYIILFFIFFLGLKKMYASIPVSIHNNWVLFDFKDEIGKICYIASIPLKKEGTYKVRGEPYFIVMRRKKSGYDEVGLSSGFILKENKDVDVSILKRKFPLFPENDKAWTYDRNDDIEIIKQMKLGAKMYVSAYSNANYIANDTYSLIGFNEAYDKMLELCK